MDTKTARRNFYKNKVYFSDKLDEKYTTQKFPEDIQVLLDEYIPNATLKQLTKFMDKKYNRIVKTFPEVEKALKKVLREKMGNIPKEITLTQVQKLISHLKEQYPNYKFQQVEGDGGNKNYKMISKQKGATEKCEKNYLFEDAVIHVPKKALLHIDVNKKGRGFYTILHQDPQKGYEFILASTEEIKNNEVYKLNVKNGNFEREANNLIENFNQFKTRMDIIENPIQ